MKFLPSRTVNLGDWSATSAMAIDRQSERRRFLSCSMRWTSSAFAFANKSRTLSNGTAANLAGWVMVAVIIPLLWRCLIARYSVCLGTLSDLAMSIALWGPLFPRKMYTWASGFVSPKYSRVFKIFSWLKQIHTQNLMHFQQGEHWKAFCWILQIRFSIEC